MINYCLTCPFYSQEYYNGCKLSRCINYVVYSDHTSPYENGYISYVDNTNIYCPNCGQVINYYDNYCRYCGAKTPKWSNDG